jgi:hypothetical protein
MGSVTVGGFGIELVDQPTGLSDGKVGRIINTELAMQQFCQIDLLLFRNGVQRSHLTGSGGTGAVTGTSMAIAFAVRDCVSVSVDYGFGCMAVGYCLLTGEFIGNCLSASNKSIANMAVEAVQVGLQQTTIQFHLDMATRTK